MTNPADEDFERFYREAFPRVVGFAATLTLSHEDTFDLTQEAFTRTWAAWDQIRSIDEPVYFTMKVAANLAFSMTRRVRRLRKLTPALVVREERDPSATSDTKIVLRSAIRGLPRKERMAVVLSYLGDMPADQVATVLGISPVTVRVHLTHARARLASVLDADSTD